VCVPGHRGSAVCIGQAACKPFALGPRDAVRGDGGVQPLFRFHSCDHGASPRGSHAVPDDSADRSAPRSRLVLSPGRSLGRSHDRRRHAAQSLWMVVTVVAWPRLGAGCDEQRARRDGDHSDVFRKVVHLVPPFAPSAWRRRAETPRLRESFDDCIPWLRCHRCEPRTACPKVRIRFRRLAAGWCARALIRHSSGTDTGHRWK
jgi:hypothetical protein